MGNSKKPDFTKTDKNPFNHYMAAAVPFLGLLPRHPAGPADNASEAEPESVNETVNESEPQPAPEPESKPNAVNDPQPNPIPVQENVAESKKTREARDKENGKQHIHIILPKYQADALKKMAISYGLTVTNFMQETIEMHLNGDWKARLEQMQLNQKKMEFKKEDIGGIAPINK